MRKAPLLIVLVAVLILFLIVGRFYLSEADFSLQNPSWNGMSDLSPDSNVHPLYNTSDLSSLGYGDTLLVISPMSNYTADESTQVLSFLHRGGKVVVMDDFGSANSLLGGIGSPITIDRALLCQYDDFYVNQSFPIISNFSMSAYTTNVSRLVLNHPASLNVTGDAHVLATSTSQAWIDRDDNGRLDTNERMGVYPVIARASYDNGELLVVSDPDIYINSMIDKGDNGVFMSNILKGAVWVDASHGRDITPVGALYYLARNDLITQLLVILLVFVVALLYVKRRDIIRQLSWRGDRGLKDARARNNVPTELPGKEKDNKELKKSL